MGKRKHPSAEGAPPAKKARRAKVLKSDPDDSVMEFKKRKQTAVVMVDLDDDEPQIPKQKHQRETNVKKKTANVQDSDSEDATRLEKQTIMVDSDSDEELLPRRRKRLMRGSSPVEEEDEAAKPSKGRLRRKNDDADKYKLDSDDEDLELPEAPSSTSKPTKRQVLAGALEKYARARKHRSSPAPIPSDAVNDEPELDFDPIPEVDPDEENEAEQNEDDDDGEDFIVEEGEDEDAKAALDRMRYTSRDLEENFGIFVEYMVLLHDDPKWRETASEDDKEYYQTAVAALRKTIEPLSDTLVHTTWKAPFIATLQLRPSLQDGTSCDSTGNCHACWTRGMYSCDVSGSYELSTRKGTYDPDTFQKKKERGIKYGTRTSFENNAEARNLPYPPQFKLFIGARCFRRATAYHEVRHYLYNISVRVKEKIEELCAENSELENDVRAQMEAFKEQGYIDQLWGVFKFDKKRWSSMANRKDPDVWS
ncbi:DUF4211 domain-containing protein [Mycena indigotica]|uniref:DUF4211 domain-containing protein n=1 Tax=Mycena indigotica TaxID=2126181 RepID=A0A8H6W092_9AGAR|nr:DUF4211 domain-containing protein [Mycena indigotica]KAF7294654.1 DUF4211 domain-containing protein [Mycena indigotica]